MVEPADEEVEAPVAFQSRKVNVVDDGVVSITLVPFHSALARPEISILSPTEKLCAAVVVAVTSLVVLSAVKVPVNVAVVGSVITTTSPIE